MLEVRFDMQGEEQYARRFNVIADDTRNMREPLSRIADHLRNAVGEQFLSQGSRGGTPWQPLSAAYRRWKEQHFPGRPILVRTGAMRSAFLTQGTRELTNTKLVWGITSQRDPITGQSLGRRAGWHQHGTHGGGRGGHLPARPVVKLTLADRRAFDREFVMWFNYQKHKVFGA